MGVKDADKKIIPVEMADDEFHLPQIQLTGRRHHNDESEISQLNEIENIPWSMQDLDEPPQLPTKMINIDGGTMKSVVKKKNKAQVIKTVTFSDEVDEII